MTDVTWLTREQQANWIRFAAVLELLPAALDAQLTRDAGLTHFDYFVLAMLSEAPDRTLRLTALATRTNATLARLSRVVSRLEGDGFVERRPCPADRRATNAVLTDAGWAKVVATAPGHVGAVRHFVVDAVSAAELTELGAVCGRLLARLDPDGRMFVSG